MSDTPGDAAARALIEAAWWGREAGGRGVRPVVPGPGPSAVQPELVAASQESARAAVAARIGGYTPSWTNLLDRHDAGVALVRLFGTQIQPVLERLNRLPEKMLVELLRIAGVAAVTATPARAVLQFTVQPVDGRSVLVPNGFQAGAAPAGGGEQVVFETESDLWATPAQLRSIVPEAAGNRLPVALSTAGTRPFAPFGARPKPGDALWIGLDGAQEPFPRLSIGVRVAEPPAPAPAPAAAGADPDPRPATALLRWDVLDDTIFRPAEVISDTTGAFTTTGVAELDLPGGWAPSTAARAPVQSLRWLRVTLIHGGYRNPPGLTDLRINVVPARAVRTIRNEALEPVQIGPADGRTRLRLSRTPVLSGSIRLQVENDASTGIFGTSAQEATRWSEVPSLAGHTADDRVFTLDAATGILTFGDGEQGRRVPPGFRNVTAESYQVGGGVAGRVRAGAITGLVSSLPGVTAVTNPFPASGGTDPEARDDTLRRGAVRIRARGRAVAPADYGPLALQAPGGLVGRAAAVPGLDPQRPGIATPGVIGVFVVPPPTGSPATSAPLPTAATLEAVATYLSGSVAPIGVRVVAAPPAYHPVGLEAWVVLRDDVDAAITLRAAGQSLTDYLDPLIGGDEGTGWPFGGTLRSVALTRRLLGVNGVSAVPGLSMIVDGVRVAPCADHSLPPGSLPWPQRPLLIPVAPGSVVGAR